MGMALALREKMTQAEVAGLSTELGVRTLSADYWESLTEQQKEFRLRLARIGVRTEG